MTIVPHQFANITISQAAEDIILKDGRVIPKGYVNATQMCVSNNKRFRDWEKLKSTKEYIDCQRDNPRVPKYTDFIKVDGDNNYPVGTWVSYPTAMILAQWISPEFAVWAGDVLAHVVQGNFQALTSEAEKAQKKLQDIWAKMRSLTVQTFWFVGDEIKNYYLKNPRVENYPGHNYSEVFDELNLGLFGKRAKRIKEELGITKGELNRDHFGEESLKRIEMIQRLTAANIQHHGKNPLDAVKAALAMMNYDVIDYRK